MAAILPRRFPRVAAAARLLSAALVVFVCASAASAQTNIYQMRGSSNYGIYVYNVPANTNATVYRPYPVTPAGTNSATLAQRPSDGMLFYVTYTGGNNPQLYRFNPATPNVAPVTVGAGLGGTVPSSLRMAFSPTGTLYYLPDTRLLYTINTTTGVATSTGVTIGTSAQITSGGDIAFNAAGTLYISTSAKTIWTASITTGAATQIGNAPVNFTPAANATIGLAFNAAGELLAQTQNPNNIYRIPLPVAANATPQGILVRAGDGDTVSTGDMGSANVPAPNLSITKTDGVSTVYRGGPVSYTITITNSSVYAVTGTFIDNVPATITGVTWTCSATAPSFCEAASGSGNNINTDITLEPGASATYTVNGTVSGTATGTITNTATVNPPAWLPDASPANNTASDTDTVNLNADLSITKTDGLANVNPGSVVTYTIVVSNAGPDTSNGSIVTDTVPALLTGVTWTCGSPTGGATCGAAGGSGNSINTTANLPSGGSVRYTVTGTLSAAATGTLSNTATVVAPASGVTDPNDPGRTGANNNSATDTTTINPASELAVSKTVNNASPNVGNSIVYTVTVVNNGPSNATNVRLTDLVPAGLTFVSAVPSGSTTYNSGTGLWTIGALANGATATLVINATVNAGAGGTTITNTTSGLTADQFDPVSTNNVGSVPLTVTSADLSLAKTVNNPTPTFGQNVTFTLTLTNAGPSGATGVAVRDLLPAGLVFVSATPSTGSYNSGTGIWTVGALANGASPTLQIVARVNAYGSITNIAEVSASDQSDPDSTPNNNNAGEDDRATAALGATPPNITLCKTFLGQPCPPPALPAQPPGSEITYSITFTNSGGSPATSFVLTDPDPSTTLKLNDYTDFKIGSVVNNLGTTGLGVTVTYSNNSGATWSYTPVSGAGGAPAGYDRLVTHVRWSFTGNFSHVAPNNTGSVSFIARIR